MIDPGRSPAIDVVGAVILAGGLSRRMGGGDKALADLCGKTVLERVIDRLLPQLGWPVVGAVSASASERLAINANGDPARFARFGFRVVPDTVSGNQGPLAGVLTAMEWAASRSAASGRGADANRIYVATVACDTPFLPVDLVCRLSALLVSMPDDTIACAQSCGRIHPVAALWPLTVRDRIGDAIQAGERRLGSFIQRFPGVVADYGCPPADPFFNVNTREDLDRARRLMDDIRAGRTT